MKGDSQKMADITTASPLLKVRGLKKYYSTPHGMLHALDGVDFDIATGKTLGIVGESGCGKTTLGRVILRLQEPTAGSVIFNDVDVTKCDKKSLMKLREEMQIIFQDPYSSLNPRMTVREAICEPLLICGKYDKKDTTLLDKRVNEIMDTVGLAQRAKNMYPHELDGGRRQRIGIGRALALNPKFVVCDEPVSALDMSVQAQILNLMLDLKEQMGLTYLFITHDLSVVRYISDIIAVMYLGQIVEMGEAKLLFSKPTHPYTQALISAIPIPEPDVKVERIILEGEISSPIEPVPGCRFAKRCIYARDDCFGENIPLREIEPGHFVSCKLVEDKTLRS